MKARKGRNNPVIGALAVLVILSALTATVVADGEEVSAVSVVGSWSCGSPTPSDVTATLYDDGTFTLSGTGSMSGYEPFEQDGVPWWDNKGDIKTVKISGIKRIGNYAFSDCTELTEVEVAGSVTEIGFGAFQGCQKLTSIDLPLSVNLFGNDAFNGTGLKSFDFGDRANVILNAGIFKNCSDLETIRFGTNFTYNSMGASDPNSLTEYKFYIGAEQVTSLDQVPGMTFERRSVDGGYRYVAVESHSVEYDADGGIGVLPAQSDVDEGAVFTVGGYSGTKSGYTFGGWSYGGKTYVSGDSITMGTDSIVLTAVWIPNTVTCDHTALTDIVGRDAEGVSRLVSSLTIPGHSSYEQLPDTMGYRHVGWIVGDAAVDPTAAFVTDDSHTASSIWRAVTVMLDHTALTDIVGTDAKGVSDLPASMTAAGRTGYIQLQDTAGYRHVGWIVGDATIGPTATFGDSIPDSIKSVWEKIADSGTVVPIIPDGGDIAPDGNHPVVIVPETEKQSWLGENGKTVLIIAIIAAIIGELAVLTYSRKR